MPAAWESHEMEMSEAHGPLQPAIIPEAVNLTTCRGNWREVVNSVLACL